MFTKRKPKVYDPDKYDLAETHPGYNGNPFWFMQAIAFVSGEGGDQTFPVTFNSDVTGSYEMKYWGDHTGFGFETFSYNIATFLDNNSPYWGGPYPSPGSVWEDKSYTFSVGGVTETLYLPSDSLAQLATPNVSISGSLNPTFSWDPVAGAEYYAVGIYSLNVDDYPNWGDNLFMGYTTQSSFTYTGDIFSDGDQYAIMIQARDFSSSTSTNINRSDFVTMHSAPVPEPATMLLLGTGLIGLAGARRKMKK